jgi:hypothetical protein
MAKCRVSTNTYSNSNKTAQNGRTDEEEKYEQIQAERDRSRLFTFKHELFKMSVHFQTALAAETYPGGGQWLKEQLNVVN